MPYQKEYTSTFEIKGHRYSVTAPALFDSETDELIPDKQLDDRAAEMARQLHRERFGLLNPADLKKYRARVGLSQRNLAELTGLSPNAIALYEAGEFPTPANNRLLEAVMGNDAVLRQYLADGKERFSAPLIKRVQAYLAKEKSGGPAERPAPRFTVNQLANWFVVKNYLTREAVANVDPLTLSKVAQLLYLAYGRYLVANKGRLFTAPIVHAAEGPVIAEVTATFKGQTVLDEGEPTTAALLDFSTVSADEEVTALLLQVYKDYLAYNAYRLAAQLQQPGSSWSLTKLGARIKDRVVLDHFARGIEA